MSSLHLDPACELELEWGATDPLIELYEFAGSCWANVPKIAISETGIKKDDIEFISIVLAEVSLSPPAALTTGVEYCQLTNA